MLHQVARLTATTCDNVSQDVTRRSRPGILLDDTSSRFATMRHMQPPIEIVSCMSRLQDRKTLRQVAAEAWLSERTVAKAYNGGNVSQATLCKVTAAAIRLGVTLPRQSGADTVRDLSTVR